MWLTAGSSGEAYNLWLPIERCTTIMKEIIAQIVAGKKVSEEQLKELTTSQRIVLRRLIRRIETLGKDIMSSVFSC